MKTKILSVVFVLAGLFAYAAPSQTCVDEQIKQAVSAGKMFNLARGAKYQKPLLIFLCKTADGPCHLHRKS